MKKSSLLIVFFISFANLIFAQNSLLTIPVNISIKAIPKNKIITVSKPKKEALTIPIEIDFVYSTDANLQQNISLKIDSIASKALNKLDEEFLFSGLEINNNNQEIDLKVDDTKFTKTFNLIIDKNFSLKSEKVVQLSVNYYGEILETILVKIKPVGIFRKFYKVQSIN